MSPVRKVDAQRSFAKLLEQFPSHVADSRDTRHGRVSIVMFWSSLRTLARICDLTPEQKQLLAEFDKRVQRPYGISDAIRAVLFLAKQRMTPVQIKDALVDLGFDMRKYTFPMANVHSALKRLVTGDVAPSATLRHLLISLRLLGSKPRPSRRSP